MTWAFFNDTIFEEGDKVHYIPFKGCDKSQIENGMIKQFTPDRAAAWVVFKCQDNWEHFRNYTGARTSFNQLRKGWI